MTFSPPHCDERVLHSRGTCKYCDMHPVKQAWRIANRINFTNTNNEGWRPCPAVEARGDSVNYWHGNQAADEGFFAAQDAYFAELNRLTEGYTVEPPKPDPGLNKFRQEDDKYE